jgi:hypothetical protein
VSQTPDTAPGNYYVTMLDGTRVALLAGPFVNDHAGALARVEECSRLAIHLNPIYHFNAFGTARYASDFTAPGKLNTHLGIEAPMPELSPKAGDCPAQKYPARHRWGSDEAVATSTYHATCLRCGMRRVRVYTRGSNHVRGYLPPLQQEAPHA